MKWWTTIGIILFVMATTGFISALEHFAPKPRPINIPKGWPEINQEILKNNPITEEGFQLGRKLFYDERLSIDNQISCGNCHQQFAAFATLDHDLSHGVQSSFTNRNAPALFNLIWMKSWYWDGGINHLELQPLSPFTAHNEMGETVEGIIAKVKSDPEYQQMFLKAFGESEISMAKINKSLVQFMASLISSNSKYDQVMRGEKKFTDIEQAGYELFKQNCNSCHREPLFTNDEFKNNGMPLTYLNDVGRQKISGFADDSLSFKVPSLRNVQVSFPYMHDGSLVYLPNVIEHYTKIDTSAKNLSPELKRKISFTQKQEYELMYFLFTLTDSTFLKNPDFSATHQMNYIH